MHDSKLESNYMRIDLLFEFYSVVMYFIINYMRLDLLYGFYSLIMDFVIHASCKNRFISNTHVLACSPSYMLTESCTYDIFFHCFQAKSIWFIAGRDRVSKFHCSCLVIFIEYVRVFIHYSSYKYLYIFGQVKYNCIMVI